VQATYPDAVSGLSVDGHYHWKKHNTTFLLSPGLPFAKQTSIAALVTIERRFIGFV
jgi:hypothetical protein